MQGHLRKVCIKRGKLLTFGRWNRRDASENVATIGSRGGMAFPHLRKVCIKRGKLLTFGRWNRHDVSANVATIGSRGGMAFPHLRKVCIKRVEISHLRKVESVRCIGKRGNNRLSGRYGLSPPSEGVHKTRGNFSPSEGGIGKMYRQTWQQWALGGCGAFAHLRKVELK